MKAIVLTLLCVTFLSCGDDNVTTNVLPEPTNLQPSTKAGELPEDIRVRFDFLKGEVSEVVYEKVLEQANSTYQGHIRWLTFIHWIHNESRIPVHVFDKLEDDKQLFFYTLSQRDRLQVAAYIDYPEELPQVHIKTTTSREAFVFYALDSNYVLIRESILGGLYLSQASFNIIPDDEFEKTIARIEDALSKRRNGRVVFPKVLVDMGIHFIIIDMAGIPKEPKYRKWYVPLSKARRATPAEIEAYNKRG